MDIVITGASRGLGYDLARKLAADAGQRVFALSRNKEGLKRLAGESTGGKIIPVVCDVTNDESVGEAIGVIAKSTNSVDILINNSGLLISNSFGKLTIDDWKSVYDVNVFGAVRMMKSLLPLLKDGKLQTEDNIRAHVVNIASMGGVHGVQKYKGLSAYTSSKGALITLTECVAEELGGMGIRVNAIALGSVDTEMFHEAFPGVKAAFSPVSAATWLSDFAVNGCRYFHGKVMELSTGNP